MDAADNRIAGTDRVVLGNPIPRLTYSFDFLAEYKGFDLAFFFRVLVSEMVMFRAGWLIHFQMHQLFWFSI
jgi:hypothetical protein